MGPTHQIYLSVLATLASVVCLATGCSSQEPEVGSGTAALLNPEPGAPSNPSAASAVILENGSHAFCTGTILSDGKVLTAAHCLDNLGASELVAGEFVFQTGLRPRGSALDPQDHDVFIVGSETSAGTSQGFAAIVQWGEVKFAQFDFGQATHSGLEAVALNQHGAFVVGWEEDIDGTPQARLYHFPKLSLPSGDSYGLAVAQGVVLGAGRPSAIISYTTSYGAAHLAVAINQADEKGLHHARVVELAVAPGSNGAPLELSIASTILPETVNYKASSITKLSGDSIAIGGIETLATLQARVERHDRLDGGTWERVAQIRGAEGATDVQLNSLGANVAILAKQRLAGADSLFLWPATGTEPMSANMFPTDSLTGNLWFSASNPYYKGAEGFRGSSIAATSIAGAPKLYLSGTTTYRANAKTETRNVVVRLDANLSIDSSFAVNGVQVSPYAATQLAPIQAIRNRTYVPLWRHAGEGLGLGDLTVAAHSATSTGGVTVGAAAVTSVKFAYGVDIAIATLDTPPANRLTGSWAFPTHGMILNCIGHGGSSPAQLGQGTFFFDYPHASGAYAEVANSVGSMTGGDSGGPCFDSNGDLAGIVAGSVGVAAPSRDSTGNMIVPAQELAHFVGEP